ncbi:hypothetical protein [Heyndrickxia camelliae]|uniref:Uncharacterized protein n=1 Tax=Heyndrickxia camelliae TaxID=1707093 RepID=A0A2N3LCW6_9BACI|nr:hypothetical protein [Heyndrickxia camelliae]PKR82492.1 hypothetical protein CWO92_24130 [Heyndrickxia camelliae]
MNKLYKGRLLVLRIVVTLIVLILMILGFNGILHKIVSMSLVTVVLIFFFVMEYVLLKKKTK